IIHPSSCSGDHYLVAYGARLMDHLARQQPLRAPGPMTRLLRSLRPVTFANFNSAQNAELVPATVVFKEIARTVNPTQLCARQAYPPRVLYLINALGLLCLGKFIAVVIAVVMDWECDALPPGLRIANRPDRERAARGGGVRHSAVGAVMGGELHGLQ